MSELKDNLTTTLKSGRAFIVDNLKKHDLSEYVSITSSNIAKIGYSTEGNLLVEFNNGTEYLYSNVPKDEYEKLRDADSVGSTLNKSIKNKYECKKLENV